MSAITLSAITIVWYLYIEKLASHVDRSKGVIRGPNRSAEGRYKIHLPADHYNRKSFKQENLFHKGSASLIEAFDVEATLHQLRENNKLTKFYQGLLDQTAKINILKDKIWCNVEYTFGKYHLLVTCT